MPLSPKPYAAKKFADIKGRRMAYIDEGAGSGPAIVFQHGNPTSSYLWRNIMPHCAGAWPPRRLRPDRHGRQRQARPLRPRPLHLRRAARLSVRAVGPPRPRQPNRPRHPRLGLGAGLRVGAPQPRARRRHRLHGGHRHAGHVGRLAGERASRVPGLPLRPPARTWCSSRTPSWSACCRARSCASSRTRRWPNTAVPSPRRARTAAPP